MPEVRPTKVLSFSSEDRAYPADNLLKVSTFCKWKCETPGTKQASVTFKFDHPVQFSRLDIANEASAFIQVEVSRADFDNFEVLLPSSSFMSPADSKKAVSLNRVRIFSCHELNMPIATQKWDIVRVVCSQPFNTGLQYGLSFIRFYETRATSDLPPAAAEEENARSDEISEILKPGGLFKMVREISESEGKRNSTTSISIKSAAPVTVTQKILQVNRAVMDAQKSDPPTTAAAPLKANSVQSVSPQSQSASISVSNTNTNAVNAGPSTSRGTGSNSSGAGASRKKRKRILDGVVVAFSGYKNPFRSELRDLCLKLGAKYRQDWTDDCTHLICAFPNTPKWNAVKGKGVITSHYWIKECDRQQKRVSWRPYRVGRAPSPVGYACAHEDDDDSQDDNSDWEASIVEAEASDDWRPDDSEAEEEEDSEELEDSDASAEAGSSANDEDADEEIDEPSREKKPKVANPSTSKTRASSGNKSRVSKRGKSEQRLQRMGKHKAAEDEDTDEEIQRNLSNSGSNTVSDPTDGPLLFLPNIFNGRKFYLFSKDFELKEEETVHRLIITFGGKVELHMNTDVEFVVSRASWGDDFDEALEVCPSLIFVKPEWIYACDKAGKFVPFQRYQIVG